ncbi:hypothetical protein D3C72_2059680 [compost metagenome]
MHDGREGGKRREADFLRRAVGPHQRRESSLYGVVAPLQRIVVRVRNFRRVLAMIKRIVAGKLGCQKCQLGRGLKLGQVFDGNLVFRHGRSLTDESAMLLANYWQTQNHPRFSTGGNPLF